MSPCSDDPPPIVQRDDGTVLIQGEQTLGLLYRCVLAGITRRHRDGVSSHDLTELRTVLYRACMSARRHRDDSRRPTTSCCTCQDGADLIGTTEAATLLSLTPRQVARLAARDVGLGGIRLGHAWVLKRAPVLALAREREASK